jgi:hypothetical protein
MHSGHLNPWRSSVKRFCVVGAAVAVSSLAFGVTGSVAAGKHKAKTPTTVTVKASCKLTLTVTVPSGTSTVAPPEDSGTEYGPASCKKLGNGLYGQSFALQDSGDTTGKFKQYDGVGSIFGTFDLTPSDSSGPPTPYSFGNGNLLGTVKVKGGTGAYHKAKGKGTLACATDDSIHFVCTEKLKLTLPVA